MMSAKPEPHLQTLSKPLTPTPDQLTSVVTKQLSQSQKKAQKNPHWQIVVTTFITVFLAEIGDKTQLTTLMISAQSHQPLIVFAGAAIALVSTSLLGVLAGKWLAKTFSPSLLNTLAGLSFLILSLSLLWDAIA
ncbi:TMEM165/GDT1 family protein [Pseudanabaena sp. FACHB-1998]|uniref:TMEM165/GDT1 family protein n=1 Tax=Pseudanabaena sp. FACHB-1998 TaxID=2692858 RepID=UPI00168162AB|nr:TMEM165/GDT1 family protein [Pseudanabaena sp. FACHB-1998]MBD2176280.1 TMEM165/GDT1 family protein [Pseudanabaena sp. FACHB-1998]